MCYTTDWPLSIVSSLSIPYHTSGGGFCWGGRAYSPLMSNQSVFRFLCSSIPTTIFWNLMVGACNPLEVYESSHVYSVNTRRSHQAPKMQRTRQKKTMYIVIQLICENTNMKKNNFLDCNYSWWTLTTLNLKGRYVGICQLQDNFLPFSWNRYEFNCQGLECQVMELNWMS